MKLKTFLGATALTLLSVLASNPQANAVTIPVTTLHSFNATTAGSNPGDVGRFLVASDGNYYAVTTSGGSNNDGTIYRLTPAGVLTVIHEFTNNADGYNPRAGLIQGTDGFLYGTSNYGGQYGYGVIYKLNLDGTGFTTIYSFKNSATDGGNPYGGIVQGADKFLYGATISGGANNNGDIYKVKTDGTGFVDIHDLSNPKDGYNEYYAPLLVGTEIYYATNNGGSTGYGSLSKIKNDGTGFTDLHDFAYATDGANPQEVILGLDGNLYGEAYNNGPSGYGTIYKIKTDGTGFTVIVALDNNTKGGYPGGLNLVQDSSKNLYYGTQSAPSGSGGLYKVKTDGTGLTVLHIFASDGSEGTQNTQATTLISGGYILGSKFYGAARNLGTIYKIKTDGSKFSLVYNFGIGYDDGYNTYSSLILGPDGNYYGVTRYGGNYNDGTIFKITPSGVETVLYNFTGNGLDGNQPFAGLVLGADGNFYGGTYYGGTYGNGTVFKFTPAGVYTPIYTFGQAAGAQIPSNILYGADGNLYGTSYYGGQYNLGTVFKLTTTGVETILHSFKGGKDGQYPNSGLLLGKDGNLYGTTVNGGDPTLNENQGTLYSITFAGVYKNLHFFTGTDGNYPVSGVIQGIDGKLYGTTSSGGSTGSGTLYVVSTSGTGLSIVHPFTASTDGGNPNAAVIQGTDKKLYGVAVNGGPNNYGTAYSLQTNGGSFAVLAAFGNTGASGSNPYGTLLEGPDGNIYGTTYNNGVESYPGTSLGGTVFKLGTTLPIITKFSPSHAAVGATVTLTGVNFTGASSVKFGSIASTFTVVSSTKITATVPAGATSAPIAVKTAYGTNTTVTNFNVP